MLYILAIIFPPLACLGAGKFLHAVLSLVLCVTGYGIPIAWVHAWMVVKNYEAEKYSNRSAINNIIINNNR